MKSDVKKPKKRKDTEVKPENWLAWRLDGRDSI